MFQAQSKLNSANTETREGDFITAVPTLQDQASDRLPTPPPSPDSVQHNLFWRQAVLHWNRSNYRMSLIEYVPCLMGLLWGEDKMGRIEALSAFPMEAQYYFVKGVDVNRLALSSTSYYRIFRTKIGFSSHRRASEPDTGAVRYFDPSGITQESFLFGRFLRHVMRTTKISCTVLILSLKYAQAFLRKIRSMNMPYCAGLESNQFRLFVTSLLLADKYSEDHPYTNKSWSTMSGLTIDDINTMERAFLQVMQHEMFVSEVDFREWTKSLQNLCHWEMPNPHHPENSRHTNTNTYTTSMSNQSARRFSFSNVSEAISIAIDEEGLSSGSSGNSFSHAEPVEKTSFWSRFRFHRK